MVTDVKGDKCGHLFNLVPIHGFIEGTGKFPIQKCAIFCKFQITLKM